VIAELNACVVGPECFEARGREIHAFYPICSADSKFTTARIDRRLQAIGTTRNRNFALKPAEAAAAL
jgi:hypothetical protein